MMLEVRGREIRTSEIDERSPGYVQGTEENGWRTGIHLKSG
jgi:hypothetical protein